MDKSILDITQSLIYEAEKYNNPPEIKKTEIIKYIDISTQSDIIIVEDNSSQTDVVFIDNTKLNDDNFIIKAINKIKSFFY